MHRKKVLMSLIQLVPAGKVERRRAYASQPFVTSDGDKVRIYTTDRYADVRFRGPNGETLARAYAAENGLAYMTRKRVDGTPKSHFARVVF